MGDKPQGWDAALLSDVANVIMGQSPPSSEVAETPLRYPFLQGNADFGDQVPVPRAWIDAPRKVAPPGASLISVRAPVGALNRADRAYGIGRGLSAVVAKKGQVEPDFVYRVLSLSADHFVSRAQGTTFDAINKADLKDLPLLVPPRPEQRKIAAILSSVDDAIAATRKVIEQTELVKQGLLQTLMTRGIGHTRFKQTELGEIPEEWEVVRLESLLADLDPAMRSGPFGSALRKDELVDEGTPLLGIDNIHVEHFRPHFTRFVSDEKFRELRRYEVRPRDVVITIMGTVGRACVLPRDVPRALSSKHLWTLSFDQEVYLPELASLQLNFAPWVQSHFASHAQGGIMSAIRSDVLRSVMLPCPPLEEQQEIHRALELSSDAGAASHADLEHLQSLKRGLLQDLLTGRVRVTPD